MRVSRTRLVFLVATAAFGLAVPTAPAGSAPAAPAAAGPAPIKVTLKPDTTGRVTSDRASCYREVPVLAYGRLAGGEVTTAGSTSTDDRGRFPTDGNPKAVVSDFFVLTPGTATCRVAQSDDVQTGPRGRKPAARKVSLQVAPTVLRGKVTSKRARCAEDVPVGFLIRFGTSNDWLPGSTTTTDDHGRYELSFAGTPRGGLPQVAVVAFADPACRVAQSPTRAAS